MAEWLTKEERIEIAGIVNKLSQLGIAYTKNVCKIYYHNADKETVIEMKSNLQKMRNIYELYNRSYGGIYGWALTKNGVKLSKESSIDWVDIGAWLPEYDYKILKIVSYQDDNYPKKMERYLENKDYWKDYEWQSYQCSRIRYFEVLLNAGIHLLPREIWEYTRYITAEDSILNDEDEDGKATPFSELLNRYPRIADDGDTYRTENDEGNPEDPRLSNSIPEAIAYT